MIKIYDVDIASRCELNRMVVQIIPDGISKDAGTDPAVVDRQRRYDPQQRQ